MQTVPKGIKIDNIRKATISVSTNEGDEDIVKEKDTSDIVK